MMMLMMVMMLIMMMQLNTLEKRLEAVIYQNSHTVRGEPECSANEINGKIPSCYKNEDLLYPNNEHGIEADFAAYNPMMMTNHEDYQKHENKLEYLLIMFAAVMILQIPSKTEMMHARGINHELQFIQNRVNNHAETTEHGDPNNLFVDEKLTIIEPSECCELKQNLQLKTTHKETNDMTRENHRDENIIDTSSDKEMVDRCTPEETKHEVSITGTLHPQTVTHDKKKKVKMKM